MSGDRRYCQDLRLPAQEVRGQAVIVVPSRSEVHVLDEVGSFLWSELRTSRTAKELAQSVWEEFDVALDQAERDVHAFLETLAGKGLLISE
jgi:hypothetical protein